MKKIIAILTAMVLVAALMVPVIITNADVAPTIKYSISKENGTVGGTAQVKLNFSENPGVNAIEAVIKFDSDLTLTSYDKAGTLDMNLTKGLATSTSQKFVLDSTGDNSVFTGDVMVFNFTVSSTASYGNHEVTLEILSACNYDEEDIDFVATTTGGGVAIACPGHTGGIATCSNKAVCSLCGEEYGELASHDFSNSVATAEHLKTPATCSSKAVYYKSCKFCGANGTDTFEDGDYAAHDFTAEVATEAYLKAAATCTDQAVYYKSCKDCGAKGTDTFKSGSALGHNYEPTVTDPTCDAQGYTTYKCSRCHDEYVGNYTDKTAHKWGEPSYTWSQDKSTCTAERVCSDFPSHKDVEIVNATSAVTTAAGCTTKGVITYTATFTNTAFATQYNTSDIEALGHNYVVQSNATQHYYECTRCHDKKDYASHTGGIATCKDQAVCIVCGTSYGELAEHTYDNTCDTTCNVCGAVRTISHTYKPGYVYDSDSHWQECAICGYKNNIEAHNMSEATCIKKAKCSVCGYEAPEYGPHTGGTPTAESGPICDVCHEEYGEKLKAEVVDGNNEYSAEGGLPADFTASFNDDETYLKDLFDPSKAPAGMEEVSKAANKLISDDNANNKVLAEVNYDTQYAAALTGKKIQVTMDVSGYLAGNTGLKFFVFDNATNELKALAATIKDGKATFEIDVDNDGGIFLVGQPKQETKPVKSPDTSDNFNVTVFAVMAVVCAAGALILLKKKESVR